MNDESNSLTTNQKAPEIDYLRWFFENADFGPADSDVREYMNESFKVETGCELPDGYEPE